VPEQQAFSQTKRAFDKTRIFFDILLLSNTFPADGFLTTDDDNTHKTNKICKTSSSTHVLLIVFTSSRIT